MHPEALILRRCYPVPASFADLRAAYPVFAESHCRGTRAQMLRAIRRGKAFQSGTPQAIRAVGVLAMLRHAMTAALKQVTGAIDEVYAVVDGREVRVAVAGGADEFQAVSDLGWGQQEHIADLMDKADRDGYWERPHEVRLDLSPRPVSHGEVARAVLVGQEALERGGVVRS